MKQALLLLSAVGVVVSMGAMAIVSETGAPATRGAQATPTKVYSVVIRAQADEMAAMETAVAQETRAALDAVAKSTSDALALDAQATRQYHDAQATAQGLNAQATRQAVDAQATAQAGASLATATAIQSTQESVKATSTRESVQATATMQAAIDNVELTRVAAQGVAAQATAQAIARETEIAENRQVLTTWAGYGVLALFLAGVAFVGYMLLPAVAARLGAIRQDERGDPPIMVLAARGTLGAITVLNLPKLWSGATVIDSEVKQPQLTHPALQDAQSKRADFVNLAKGGRPRPVVMRPGRPALPPGNGDEQWQVMQPSTPTWPARIPLSGILDGPPSVRDLILGVTVHDNGQSEIVRANMGKLVHVAVGGSSGWGKSVFLRSLAFQLAQSVEPVDLALVDLEGATFAPFAECDRLLYPVADTETTALAIFGELTDEMNKRKALYSDFPGVDSLATYNARAGDPLAPVICLVDEATALLSDKGVESAIRTLVLRARKYGLWCVLGGQDWKATSLDTAIRNQLATRVQFKALSASQSRVLLQRNGAEMLDVAGRALAIIPGREMVEIQAPTISYQDIIAATANGGPRRVMPELVTGNEIGAQKAQRIRELHAQGLSKRQIQLDVFGYAGGAAHTAVNQALQDDTTTTETPVQGAVHSPG